jgi:3-oxoacyl-[acyl-carrier-protein] synthase-1
MSPIYAIATNITTSLGLTTDAVWEAIIAGSIGIQSHEAGHLSTSPFWASRIDDNTWARVEKQVGANAGLTQFERMCLYSAQSTLSQCATPPDLNKTILILATTKGNIEKLEDGNDERNLLARSAAMVAKALGMAVPPVVVSHACVSGVTALLYGMRLLENGEYTHALVVGADRLTRFVLSGFQSFQAIADAPCRPFDTARNGINLGEAAATILLSTDTANQPMAQLCSGSTSNDANHISGPSRTGEELSIAIGRALTAAGLKPGAIDAVSAHGTATNYNDEMEAKAFAHAGLLHASVYSMKGYVGHTLGAAGILESAIVIKSLQEQQLIPSPGFSELGVSEPLKISVRSETAALNYVLKTASGFGGCNAVAIWGKV